jgi:hypothetical protein
MILNKKVLGPVSKYYDLLVEAKILNIEDSVLVDPDDQDWSDYQDIIILQQGEVRWDLKKIPRAKMIITSSLIIFESFRKLKNIFLIPFPIREKFKKIKNWKEREDAVYYHGRIIPQKLGFLSLSKIVNSGIKVVLRGPICKDYWSETDLTDKLYLDYKEKISKLDLEFLPATNSEEVIIEDLNKYRFYFTLSNGEAFNLGLQEAVSCGTIPIVRHNDAYWWADHMLARFLTAENFIDIYNYLRKEDLEEYSTLLAKESDKRFNFNVLLRSFEDQNKMRFLSEEEKSLL